MKEPAKTVTREEWQLWERRTSIMQYTSLAGLFAMIIILEAVGKETARVLVWPLASALFIFATAAFIVGRIGGKKMSAYFKQEGERLKNL